MSFSVTTTLAARTFAPFLQECKTKGYTIKVIYFWLRSPDLAVQRVTRGGHSIPEDVIRRRYSLCRKNLIKLYLPLSDGWMIFDNSEPDLQLVAECIINQETSIYSREIWSQIVGGTDA